MWKSQTHEAYKHTFAETQANYYTPPHTHTFGAFVLSDGVGRGGGGGDGNTAI